MGAASASRVPVEAVDDGVSCSISPQPEAGYKHFKVGYLGVITHVVAMLVSF